MTTKTNTHSPARTVAGAVDWGTPNTAGVSIPHELVFDQICHSMGGTSILDDVSLTAKSSTVTCLLGPSGSGKTTLLRIAAGMEEQDSGRILLDQREISGPKLFLPPEKRGIGLVFQDYALFPHLSILRNVEFGLQHLKRGERKAQALAMLGRVGLADRCDDFPHQLSGGEQQRVALARAMAPRPGVILMDEPFSGLDSRLRDTMREETLGVLRETRATSIIVTHDPEEALRMGDKIALLRTGRLEQFGSGHDLYFRPNSLFVAEFFSELNIFNLKSSSGKVETPLGPIQMNGTKRGDPVTAAIRVNAIKVQEAAKLKTGSSTSTNAGQFRAQGRIIAVHFSGEHDHLKIGVNGAEVPIRARVPAGILSAGALEGREDVVLEPSLKGSFAFPTSG